MLALIAFVQGLAPEPPLTVAELRREVPAELRRPAPPAPSENGWDLAIGVTGGSPTGTLSPDELATKSTTAPRAAKPGESVEAILKAWRQQATPDLRTRAKRALVPYDAPLRALAAVAARTKWAPPALTEGMVGENEMMRVADVPGMADFRSMAYALCLRARLRLAEGQPAASVDDLILARTIGSRLAAGDGPLLQALVGYAIEAITDREVELLAGNSLLPGAERLRLIRNLAALDAPDRYARTLQTEFDDTFVRFVAAFPDPAKADPAAGGPDGLNRALTDHPKPFDRRATIREGATVYAQAVRNASLPWTKRQPLEPSLQELTTFIPKDVWALGEDAEPTNAQIDALRQAAAKVTNPLGRILASTMLTPAAGTLDQAEQGERRARADDRAAIVILAAARFHAAHKKYPASLAELTDVPVAIRTDPFSEETFRYDPQRGVFWSVGPNGKNDGGKDAPGRFSGSPKDYVWPISGKIPPA